MFNKSIKEILKIFTVNLKCKNSFIDMFIPVLFLILNIFSTIRADEFHYVEQLIGQRAAAMGGAAIALSDDPSGIYYNPAGIFFSMENYFSLSANSYSVSSKVYEDVFPGRNYTYTSSSFIPNFFGFTQNYSRFKWGFILAIPKSELIDQDDQLNDLSTVPGEINQIHRKVFRQNMTTLLGPALAFELAQDLTMGFSLLGQMHTDKIIDTFFLTYNPISNIEKFYFNNRSMNRTIYSLYPKLGFQYMPFSKMSLGFTLAKPIEISNSGKQKIIRRNTDSSGPVDITNNLSHDISIDTNNSLIIHDPNPLEIGVGFGYFPCKSLLLASDITYFSQDDQFTQYQLQKVINISLGIEYYLSDSTALRGGLFSNNPNTASVVAGQSNQKDNVVLYGSSLSVTFSQPGSSFTFGIVYSKGQGMGNAVNDSITPQTIKQSMASVFISGSYRL